MGLSDRFINIGVCVPQASIRGSPICSSTAPKEKESRGIWIHFNGIILGLRVPHFDLFMSILGNSAGFDLTHLYGMQKREFVLAL